MLGLSGTGGSKLMIKGEAKTTSLNKVEISRAALRHNFHLCVAQGGDVHVMPMIKADGYGHGMVECARVFSEEGAAAFGVAESCEGRILRKAGISEPIYVLVGLMPESIPEMLHYRLTPVVVDGSLLSELSGQAVAREIEVGVHIKMDAGMGRQGCFPEEVPDIIREVNDLPGLQLEGIMAHFPMADEAESDNTLKVFDCFQKAVSGVELMLPPDCCLHIANSGGLFHFTTTALHMVRPGIALYGCNPDGKDTRADDGLGLKPVMRFATQIIQVRSVPVGTGLGYGQTYVTSRETKLAVLPVGYEDGYLRKLSGRAQVLVNGQRVPVVGRISMNLTLVDITDIEQDVKRGDEVVLMGSQGDEIITADEIASWMDTISYEVLCLFGNLNDRYYID